MELLDAPERHGALVLGPDLGVDFLNDTQSHQVTKKRIALARHQRLCNAGRLAPETVELRCPEPAVSNDPAENARQRLGAARRAKDHVKPDGG